MIATVNTDLAIAGNAMAGKSIRFTAGAVLGGTRWMVHVNGPGPAAVLAPSGELPAVPGADVADRYVLEDRVGSIAWTGDMQIVGPGWIDSMLFLLPDNATLMFRGTIQTTGNVFRATGAGGTASVNFAGRWTSGNTGTSSFSVMEKPAAVIACADRFEGVGGTLNVCTPGLGTTTQEEQSFGRVVFGAVSMQSVLFGNAYPDGTAITANFENLSAQTGCAVLMGPSDHFAAFGLIVKDPVLIPSGASYFYFNGGSFSIRGADIGGANAGGIPIVLLDNGCRGNLMAHVSGVNGGGAPWQLMNGSYVTYNAAHPPTIEGVAAGADVIVGSNAVTSYANIAGGAAPLAQWRTDFNAASAGAANAQGCIFRPQN